MLYAEGQRHGCEGSAALEGAVGDGCEASRQRCVGQHAAAREGFGANLLDVVAQRNLLELGAAGEGAGADGLDGLRQLDGRQSRAAVEGIVGDGGETCEVVEFVEGGYGAAFESVAQVGDGSGLAVGERAVAVGVECLGAEALDGCHLEGNGARAEVDRLDADDAFALLAVAAVGAADALAAGQQAGEEVVAIGASTAPAPVDVVAEVAVVAVAYEGVASGAVGTAEVHGSRVSHLVVDHGVPLYLGEAFTVEVVVLDRFAEAEIGGQRVGHLVGVGAGGRVGVTHLHRRAAVPHQVGNGFLLLGGG